MKADWWYMRDNHTFRQLKGTKKDIRLALMEEMLNGNSYGMLCTKTKGYEHIHVHAGKRDDWEEFIDKCMEVIE
jgi:hypothetical protein